MPNKVTDPTKQVTDSVLLSELARQGIDKDFVELYQDYAPAYVNGKKVKGQSPYAKFYRDLKSNRGFMVVSGLPMVDADGIKIEPGWWQAGKNYFSEKGNLFRARVQGTDIELICKNDQPDGRKANNRLSYNPQLFLNGIEQICGQPILLPVDPLNPNYLENTLEWNYGICKRRLRQIEGGVYGSWTFPTNPNGEVRIKYNQTGDYKLRLGQFRISNDEEVIKPGDFDELAKIGGYPVIVSDSATYYPDANPETTSVDGQARQSYAAAAGVSWATIIAAAGNNAADSSTSDYPTYISEDGTGYDNKWKALYRCIFLFDTSGLPDTAIISAAVLSLYGIGKNDTGTAIAPNVNLYSSAPASNTAVVGGDFDSLGTTPFCDTPITYANWKTASPYWNDFDLNAAGIAAIDKAGVSKFGTRNANYDVAATAPAWTASGTHRVQAYFSEQGTGYKPTLVVTYTLPIVAPTVTTQAVSDIATTTATGNGNITDTGGENASAWGVCYNTTGNPTTADSTAAGSGSGGAGAFTAPMTSLTNVTKYYVKAYATNSAGTGYGAEVNFTTLGIYLKISTGTFTQLADTNKALYYNVSTGRITTLADSNKTLDINKSTGRLTAT